MHPDGGTMNADSVQASQARIDPTIGLLYPLADVATWLGVPIGELTRRAGDRELLCVLTGDGLAALPAWQFLPDRTPIPHLQSVLDALDPMDDRTKARWLVTPVEEFDRTPSWQSLAEGRDPTPVRQAAAEDAARWSQ